MKKLYLLFAFACVWTLSGCGSGSQPLTVTVTAASASVQAGGMAQITAIVANDSANKGVTWTVTCSAAQCGSVSPTTTASGAATTYTAPSTPPASDLTVTITATPASDTTKTGTTTIKVLAITVSAAPGSATVMFGKTASFTATVANDPGNKGVAWTVTCSTAPCGSVSPTSTSSGVATTYTAPSNPPASNLTVTITATSVADNTKTNVATVTVPAITVAVQPPTANVPVKGAQQFTATVNNDAGNKGVTWALTQGGTACSPGCGSITATTASGAPATYTAPATVPSNATVTITATSVSDLSKFATATATVVGITVSVSPASASVIVNATQQFTPTVTNDVSNGGVTWTLTQGGVACAPTCGTVAPTTTASGTATTYTAPATVPATPTVTLTATSVADATKFASATITVTTAPPVSVSISPTNPTVTTNATQQFTATVTNDPAAQGVTWTLTQSGAPCASAVCGSVSPTSGTGNAPSTTYTAPATVPTPAAVTITATSVADTTKTASTTITVSAIPPCGTGSEAKLNGQYAFLLQGFDANGPVAIAGSFTANGAATNNITAGQEDVNRNIVAGVTNPTITTAGSSYSIGSDNRGCLTLVAGTTTSTYRFSLGSFAGTPSVATKGHMVSFDATGTNVVGVFEKQDSSAFSNAAFSGNFAFGASSPTLKSGTASRFGVAGTFTASGGNITAAEVDTDDNGAPMHISSFTGTYTVAASGRGTLTLNPPGTTVNAGFYVVSANEALLMSIDPQTGVNANSLFGGSVLKQSGGPFGIGSLNGTNIISIDGMSGTGSDVQVGFLTPAGNGTFTLSTDENKAGTITTNSLSGTYTVASNGRVTVTGGTNPPVIYLVSANKGFLVGTDTSVITGSFEPQVGSSFTNASLSGSYFFGDEAPVVNTSSLQSGVATPDGVGTINGTSDNNQAGTLVGGQTFTNPYTVSSSGRTTVGSNNVLYIVSSSKAYLMSIKAGKADSTITVVEK